MTLINQGCARLFPTLTFPVLIIGCVCVVPAYAANAEGSAQSDSTVTTSQRPAAALLVDEGSKVEVIEELDPYYTNVGVSIPLTHKPIPTIRSTSESVIYSELIQGSLIPRYMLIEASVYPMPLLGTYLKRHHPNFYGQERFGRYSNVNIIESATAGFQEPWALSVFFGNIAEVVRPGENRKGSNIGYAGYLVSAGSKHIKSNDMIDDHWLELEWKIKGKVDYLDEKLGWSFRVGTKLHKNEYITDVIYMSILRSNLNAHSPFLSWANNSAVEVKLHFSKITSHLIRQEYIVGKKYPQAGRSYTPTLDVGVIWSSAEEYDWPLRTSDDAALTLVFRPSIQF